MEAQVRESAYEAQGVMPHSRRLLPYTTMTASDYGNPPCLIGNFLHRPVWLGGNELAKNSNAPMGHGLDFRSW